MTTTVTSAIRSSGGDYTSLSGWFSAKQGDIVSADQIQKAECYDDWASGLNDTLNLTGATTDSTRYYWVTTASGAGHGGIPQGGFWLTATAGFVTTITANQNYSLVEGIDVEMPADRRNVGFYHGDTSVGIVFKNCIAASGGTGFKHSSTTNTASSDAINCLAFGQIQQGGAFGIGFYRADSQNTREITRWINCVAQGAQRYGYRQLDGGSGIPANLTVRNCAGYGATTADFSIDATSDVDYCADGDGSVAGAHSVTGIGASDFNNAASNDFHLSGTGSTLYHAGTPVSGVVYDIDGDAYDTSTPSIGFDEVAGSGTQNLAPSLFSETNTFYSQTVSPGAVGLAPSLYSEAGAFYSPTVGATYGLTPGLFSDADAFYSPSVSATYDLAAARFDESNAFYSPTVGLASGPQDLAPSLFTETNNFYSPTVSPGAVDLVPSLYTESNTIYSPGVSASYELLPGLFTETDQFYAPTVAPGAVDLLPGFMSAANVFYSPSVSGGARNWVPVSAINLNSGEFVELLINKSDLGL